VGNVTERLILASASPRRRAMLADAGYRFDVAPPRVDESVPHGTPPAEAAVALAVKKARAVDARAEAWVLAADTLLDLDGAILGKPADPADAARILRALSGREHVALTGVAVRRGGREWTGIERTRVRFRPLSARDIDAYVATGEPMGKAGAYAVQGKAGAALVERVDGPVDNVIGLPMGLVRALLSEAGFM
jgi:septum formation protein